MITVRVSSEDAEAIIKHPEMYADLIDDGSPDRDDFVIPPTWTNVTAYFNNEPAGFACIAPLNYVTAEIHFGVLPEYRYRAVSIGKKVIEWIWENTAFQKVIAQTHQDRVARFTVAVGFDVEGTNRRSFSKDGELIDQTYLGVQKCHPE